MSSTIRIDNKDTRITIQVNPKSSRSRRAPRNDVIDGASFPAVDFPVLNNLQASVKTTVALMSQVKTMTSQPEIFDDELTRRMHRMALRFQDLFPYLLRNAYLVKRMDQVQNYMESQTMHFNRINLILTDCIFRKLHGHVSMHASPEPENFQIRDEVDQIYWQLDGHAKILLRVREDVSQQMGDYLTAGNQVGGTHRDQQTSVNLDAPSGDDDVDEDYSSDEERR